MTKDHKGKKTGKDDDSTSSGNDKKMPAIQKSRTAIRNSREDRDRKTKRRQKERKTHAAIESNEASTDGGDGSATFLSPQEIQDNRVKQNELERRQATERENTGSGSKVGVAGVERTKQIDEQLPNQVAKHWAKHFDRESKHGSVLATSSVANNGLDGDFEGKDDDRQRERKQPPTPNVASMPGAHAFDGPGVSERLNPDTENPPSNSQDELVEANKVDEAETIQYAEDVTKDNFRRKLLVGGIIAFALALAIGLGVGLSGKGTPACEFGPGDPCCDTSYPSEETHQLCCYPYDNDLSDSLLIPLSCYCFDNTNLILESETLYNATLYDATLNSYKRKIQAAFDDYIIDDDMDRSSCRIDNQVFLMFSNERAYNTFLYRKSERQQIFFFFAAYLYVITDGTAWETSDNWFDPDYIACEWFGLACLFEETVSTISLPNNNLEGEIPSQLGLLSSLREINFSGNHLEGTIPSELGRLSSLTSLLLGEAQLSGSIPAEFGNLVHLNELSLAGSDGNCGLTGTIPMKLFTETIRSLDLSQNSFDSFPEDGIVLAPNLNILKVARCGLTGTLPSTISSLTQLLLLDVSENNLMSTIPGILGQMTSLNYLNVAFSGLDETISDEFCTYSAQRPDGFLETELIVVTKFSGDKCACSCCDKLGAKMEEKDDIMEDNKILLACRDTRPSEPATECFSD